MNRLALVAVALLATFLVACDDDNSTNADSSDSQSASAETTGTADDEQPVAKESEPKRKPKPSGTELVATDSQFGSILFGPGQRAIYLFDKENSSESECYGACADAWPPVLTKGEPVAGGGLDQKKIGTTKRDDGTTQVTYGGHPLYYYVDDPPGQVLCHNVPGFGGLWLVVDPGGSAVS